MSRPTRSVPSNHRAGFFLVVSLVLAGSLAAPARGEVHLTDEASGVAGQAFGASISELEDLNGDGRGEFLVGALGDDVAGLNAGAVFCYLSRPANSHGLEKVWRGVAGEQFGHVVARIGDVNSDGRPDFAVGAPYSDTAGADAGRVCLFWGGSTLSSSPDLVILGDLGGGQFGFSISAAGDFNGDGEDDFIVGAPLRNAGATQNGAAFVIFGGNGGPSTDLGDALMLTGEIAYGRFGWSVTDAGNFLGTAQDCVAVGAPYNTADGMEAGAAYVYEGSTAPTSPNAVFDLKIRNGADARPFSQYGFAVRNAGRWDGDGYDDLAIGAPYCDEGGNEAGRVEIVFGGPSPSATGNRSVNGQAATDHFGWSLARVGQVDGSSSEDLLVGAPDHDSTAADAGRAYLYLGGSSSYDSAASLVVLPVAPLNPGTAANDRYGFAVASAGLFDADADLDYAVAAPVGSIGTTAAAGYVWVHDSTGGVVAAALAGWDAAWTPDGAVDLRFAVNLARESLASLLLERRVLDAGGNLVESRTAWQGALDLAGSGGPVDLGAGLVFDGAAFLFTDSGVLPPDAYTGGLQYVLTLTGTDGAELTLDALAGPGTFTGSLPVPQLALDAAWPNPFNPTVSVRFLAPVGGEARCRVTDLRGRHVATLFSGAGSGVWRTVTWDGRADDGRLSASGVYLVSLEGDGQRAVRRVVLAK